MARIDFFIIRQSTYGNGALYSRRTDFSRRSRSRLLWPIIPIAALIYVFWPASGKDHQAIEVTPDEHIRWALFHREIDEALQVQTVDAAFKAVWSLEHSVGYLPYKDELHRQDAYGKLKNAGDHLVNCETAGRTDPQYWRSRLSDALLSIPKYVGRVEFDDTPPPPVIDYAALNALE
jgi:hypothetical protein